MDKQTHIPGPYVNYSRIFHPDCLHWALVVRVREAFEFRGCACRNQNKPKLGDIILIAHSSIKSTCIESSCLVHGYVRKCPLMNEEVVEKAVVKVTTQLTYYNY